MVQERVTDFEKILTYVGEYGRFQKKQFLLFCLAVVGSAGTVMMYSFTGFPSQYRCFVPDCDNDVNPTYHEPWLNFTTPFVETEDKYIPSECELYARHPRRMSSLRSTCPVVEFIRNQTGSCEKWVFDKSLFRSTIVSEFILTCRREWLQPLGGSMYMAGMLVGSFVFGWISDRYGRKPCFMLNVLFTAGGSLTTAFVPEIITFCVCRFLTGMGAVALFSTSFVLATELVSDKYRTFCGMVMEFFFPLGEILAGGGAYFLRRWRTYQVVLSAPMFLYIFYWWLIPESPRWLIANKRYQEAEKIIHKVAAVNKKVIPAHLLVVTEKNTDLMSHPSPDTPRGSLMDLMTSPVLRRRALNMFFNWTVTSLTFYGLSMNSTNLSGDIFLNFVLTAAVEFPSYLFCIVFLDKLGRRNILALSQLLAGASCIGAGFVPASSTTVQIVLSLLGKFGSSCAFATVYIFTVELFPTTVRNTAIGFSSTFARIGGIVAPVLAGLGSSMTSLPFLLMGGMSMLAGLLALLLPETLGKKLPGTTQEAEESPGGCACCFKKHSEE